MQVAMLTSWNEPCGIADFSRALVTALQRHIDVKVVPLKHGQTQARYFQSLGEACNDCDLVHIQHEYAFYGGRDPWNCHWGSVLRGIRIPYVVSSHTWLKPFIGGPVGKRVMRSLRSGLYKVSGWQHYLEAGQFAGARRVIVFNQAYQQELIRRGLPAGRVEYFPQGVPEEVLPGDARAARSRWELKGRIIVIFGFLFPSKGHLLALRAWEQALPNTMLVIAGGEFSGKEAHYARQVAKAAEKFPKTVRLTGYLSEQDLADLLEAADLVVLPYLNHTSSYALSRVLAAGVPVLASDLACFREIREANPCLELFRTGEVEDLSVKMRDLLEDTGKRCGLQQAARRWVQEHGWNKVAEDTVKLYKRVLNYPALKCGEFDPR